MSNEPPVTTQSFVKFETEHIMPIPESERRGTSWGLFAIWFGLNMMPLTVVTGAVASGAYGLPIGWSIFAILLGNVIGGFGAALHASQGPHLGIPQMLQARGQFGYQGGSLFALIALVMFVGLFVSILIVAKEALVIVIPELDGTWVIIGFAAIGILICIVGYDLLQKMMIYLSMLIGVTIIVSMVMMWMQPEVTSQHAEAAFSSEGFFAMVAIGVVWQLAYAPYVSDYTRYLPSKTGPKRAFWMTYTGLVASSVFVMMLGVLLGAANAGNPLMALSDHLGGIGVVILVIFAVTSVLINGVELYSAVMNGLTVLQTSFKRLVITTRTRVLTTIGLGAVATVIALLGQGDFMTTFESFLMLLLYVLIPWSAINLADYFIVVKGHYKVGDLFRRDGGRYGRWNWVGLTSYAVGLAAQVPFMITPFFTSPLAEALQNVDIAWLVGFAVTAAVYLVLSRVTATGKRLKAAADDESAAMLPSR
ncbi:cytosine permease [Pseudoclavibacter endophyticus]|uniref:Cytosine permease n=1 Tax=Pseudoclavibacter endophyticus TaxID=1778590 RepID=A0A6H9WDF4_9MICO|nr:cytosine permease [Pseudoclavibacter endophyticus]KAB1648939.1 cytosine permease [Pseudoclavibacter endophyticus]GGA66961.1 cytosine permease [Pseudoclavibacter endophyticus]